MHTRSVFNHPSGVRRLLNGRSTKGGPADPVVTATLASKRSLFDVTPLSPSVSRHGVRGRRYPRVSEASRRGVRGRPVPDT
jgi:hypothetical protein